MSEIKNLKTAQEIFWKQEFGINYIDRNKGDQIIAGSIALFSKIIARTQEIQSVIEFGANIGNNLKVIQTLLPGVEMRAVEINDEAVRHLNTIEGLDINHMSILDYSSEDKFDLVFTKGVLIHINPDYLQDVYDKLYHSSKKYICIAEYYNPTPVSLDYRGHKDRLFKRDFAGELLNKFNHLKLIDYGFVYKRDANFPLDDITWFLMEKI